MPIPFMGAVDPAQIQQQLASMRQMLSPGDRRPAMTYTGEMTDPRFVPADKPPAFPQPQGQAKQNPLLAAILGMSRAAASR